MAITPRSDIREGGILAGVHTVAESLRASGLMLWQTLWALVLGFTISGVVQTFVSPGAMRRQLGVHGPRALARATVFGAASSSCSYAAAALGRSLVQRGADFTAAMVFMVASTNLVAELGLVLWLLLGWQFTAAEFIGGAVMIVLLGLVLPRMVAARVMTARQSDVSIEAHPDSPRAAVRSQAAWARSAADTLGDVRMLRTEMVLGFVAAGFLAVAVPASFWSGLFVSGHGFWTTLENALLGPFVALISCVCSIGNVALAAALWKDGISFAGVVAFVFADLIALPLVLIYRKQYGAAVAFRLVAVFWLVMSLAGVATQYLFDALGWLPGTRPTTIAPDSITWNHTAYLNVVAGLVVVVLVWLSRQATPTTHACHTGSLEMEGAAR
jgi:uncharacterized membrane protein YraQ (UPF0718 family)